MRVIENRKRYFLLSLVMILIGFCAMAYHASKQEGVLNWDVDFIGGTAMYVDLGKQPNEEQLKKDILEYTGLQAQIQQMVGTNAVTLKFSYLEDAQKNDVMQVIEQDYPAAILHSADDVGATISAQTQTKAVQAVLLAVVVMLLYISVRFRDFRAGISAIAALLHDLLVVISVYALLRIPVNQTFIAVLLTILGYSINATIIIFDRIRQNKDLFAPNRSAEKINKSVGQTLARSINTTMTTFLPVLTIFIFGVESIREFALPMMIGILVGAYSSICISGGIWYVLLPKEKKSQPQSK